VARIHKVLTGSALGAIDADISAIWIPLLYKFSSKSKSLSDNCAGPNNSNTTSFMTNLLPRLCANWSDFDWVLVPTVGVTSVRS